MADVLYLTISSDIEEKIRSGELRENDKLPSERTLALKYGVSRTVVREALRVLNEKGLVNILVGKGIYISLPKEDYLVDKFESVIDNRNITSDDIAEARQIIETAIAKLAVRNAGDAEVGELRAICRRMEAAIDNIQEFIRLDAEFHYQLAVCSGNELLRLISITLNNVTDRGVFFGSMDDQVRKNALKEHASIVNAIEQRDAVEVVNAVERHIRCFASISK